MLFRSTISSIINVLQLIYPSNDTVQLKTTLIKSSQRAHLMRARIYTRDGHFASARTSLSLYIKAKGKKMDKEAEELDLEITQGERLKEKADKERKAQLWNACVETASEVSRIAGHSVEIRTWRGMCAGSWRCGK